MSRLLSQRNLELLEAIATHEPDSISEAADLVERDYNQVHRNLSELADAGVIGFEGGGPGSRKKPVMAYDGLKTDLPFTTAGHNSDLATP